MLLIALGYLTGAIRFGSFNLGPVAEVLFAGLFFGHFGLRLSPDAQSLGAVIAVIGSVIAILASKQIDVPPGTAAGILAGGLTSSPTLAAAQEANRAVG